MSFARIAYLVVIIWGVAAAKPFLLPICLAGLLALLMAPIVKLMLALRAPEWLAITVSALILLLPFVALGFGIERQGESFVREFPSIIKSVGDTLNLFGETKLGQRLGLQAKEGVSTLSNLLAKISSQTERGISLILGGLAAVLNAGSQMGLIVLLAILMVASRDHLRKSSEAIVAQLELFDSPRLLTRVVNLIERFLLARLIIVAIVGGFAALVLQLAGVAYGLVLGAFVGVMTLVPAIGFIVSLIPFFVVAIATHLSLPRTFVSLAALLLLNIADNYLFTPKFVGNRLNINPLATFIGLLGGGLIWGIWGMLLSVPFLGVLRIVLSAIPAARPWAELLAARTEEEELAHIKKRKAA
jgi:predicted PurR-regulated permease PerM